MLADLGIVSCILEQLLLHPYCVIHNTKCTSAYSSLVCILNSAISH